MQYLTPVSAGDKNWRCWLHFGLVPEKDRQEAMTQRTGIQYLLRFTSYSASG